jgi:hypothetical protein
MILNEKENRVIDGHYGYQLEWQWAIKLVQIKDLKMSTG